MNEHDINLSDEELTESIARLQDVIEAAKNQQAKLLREKHRRGSIAVIKSLAITRDNVQCRDAEEVPYCSHVAQFAEWLKSRPVAVRKRFCEWNGLVYMTSELIDGRLQEIASYEYVTA